MNKGLKLAYCCLDEDAINYLLSIKYNSVSEFIANYEKSIAVVRDMMLKKYNNILLYSNKYEYIVEYELCNKKIIICNLKNRTHENLSNEFSSILKNHLRKNNDFNKSMKLTSDSMNIKLNNYVICDYENISVSSDNNKIKIPTNIINDNNKHVIVVLLNTVLSAETISKNIANLNDSLRNHKNGINNKFDIIESLLDIEYDNKYEFTNTDDKLDIFGYGKHLLKTGDDGQITQSCAALHFKNMFPDRIVTQEINQDINIMRSEINSYDMLKSMLNKYYKDVTFKRYVKNTVLKCYIECVIQVKQIKGKKLKPNHCIDKFKNNKQKSMKSSPNAEFYILYVVNENEFNEKIKDNKRIKENEHILFMFDHEIKYYNEKYCKNNVLSNDELSEIKFDNSDLPLKLKTKCKDKLNLSNVKSLIKYENGAVSLDKFINNDDNSITIPISEIMKMYGKINLND